MVPLQFTKQESEPNSIDIANQTNGDSQRNGRNLNCESCGIKVVGRILGGKEAKFNEFPWMAQLWSGVEFICGGSLITRSHVLTAAHCIIEPMYGSQHQLPLNLLKVILGSYEVTLKHQGIERNLIEIIKHPNFNPSKSTANDIAILKLERSVNIDRMIRPLCLPSQHQNFVGHDGIVIGWGARSTIDNQHSQDLMKLTIPIVSYNECRKSHGKVVPGTLCAGYDGKNKDTCAGDSGGPLMAVQDGVWYQAGIVSFGAGGICGVTYGVYTQVTSFLDWIASNVNSDQCGHSNEI